MGPYGPIFFVRSPVIPTNWMKAYKALLENNDRSSQLKAETTGSK